ncbi:hypothetical protein Tco_0603950 [Tanacetum coccineum]
MDSASLWEQCYYRRIGLFSCKATNDESNKWLGRLGHVNCQTRIKLVKGKPIVRGFTFTKIFQNTHTCVALSERKATPRPLVRPISKLYCATHLTSSYGFCLRTLHLEWDQLGLFDLDYLTDSMNYHPVRSENQANLHAGQQEANHNAESEKTRRSKREEEQVFLDELKRLKRQEKEANEEAGALRREEYAQENENLVIQAGAAKASSTNIFSTVNTPAKASSTNLVNTVSIPVSTASPHEGLSLFDPSNLFTEQVCIYVADFTNLEFVVNVSPIPTSRIISSHPSTLILGDLTSAVQTRRKVNKSSGAHAFICLLGKKAYGTKVGFIDNKKDVRGVVVRTKQKWFEAIRIFLAFASLLGLNSSINMDVEKASFVGKIDRGRVNNNARADGIFISQDKYVAEILKKFDFANVKTASTPIETQKPLVKDEEASDVDVHLLASIY